MGTSRTTSSVYWGNNSSLNCSYQTCNICFMYGLVACIWSIKLWFRFGIWTCHIFWCMVLVTCFMVWDLYLWFCCAISYFAIKTVLKINRACMWNWTTSLQLRGWTQSIMALTLSLLVCCSNPRQNRHYHYHVNRQTGSKRNIITSGLWLKLVVML